MHDQQRRARSEFFSQIDVAQAAAAPTAGAPTAGAPAATGEVPMLLREMLAAQDRQNELLEEIVSQLGTGQRQRAAELGNWKHANPGLSRACRSAANALGKVQTEYLVSITQEINENSEALQESSFMLNEFVDRFGPRLAHLNGLLQVLSQLGSTSNPVSQTQS